MSKKVHKKRLKEKRSAGNKRLLPRNQSIRPIKWFNTIGFSALIVISFTLAAIGVELDRRSNKKNIESAVETILKQLDLTENTKVID
jgi:hypothetical protein